MWDSREGRKSRRRLSVEAGENFQELHHVEVKRVN
jgi:hypothetical protein